MFIDYKELLTRIIKYIILILTITIAIYIIPIKDTDKLKYGIFIGIIAATICSLYDYFIPSVSNDIKKAIKL